MTKKILTIDVETTGATNGTSANPYSPQNRLCYVGCGGNFGNLSRPRLFSIEYDNSPYGDQLGAVDNLIRSADILVAHNSKFDLGWLYRYGIDSWKEKTIWDTQLFEYLRWQQNITYPSLNRCLEIYGLPTKLDIVKDDYWNKGIDTDEVPREILEKYLTSDVNLTYILFEMQRDPANHKTEMSPDKTILFKLMCKDIKVLLEMDHNGYMMNFDLTKTRSGEIDGKVECIARDIYRLAGRDDFSLDSGYHLSAFLYGGNIMVDGTEDYIFNYKDGRTALKTRKTKNVVKFQRQINPLAKTELAKEGFYKTDAATLIKLSRTAKGNIKKIISLLLERRSLTKLQRTYYDGYKKIYDDMDWEDNIVHGNTVQCGTHTGRLASNNPNKQNLPNIFRECVMSRFA